MNSRYWVALGLLCLMAAGRSSAATLFVSTRAGQEKGDGASWATAHKSLTPALLAARPGDEIWVAAGVYRGNYVLRSGVRLYGGFGGHETRRFDRDWRKHTTSLNGSERAPVVTIEGGKTPHRTVLDGFTIQDGQGYLKDDRSIGGGVLVRGPVGALIAHNTIRNNAVRGRVNAAGPQMADGGGIGLMDGASAVIKNNLILRNVAVRNGGGIALWDASDVSIFNNTLLHNTAENGGAMSFETPDVQLLNNLVAFNSSGLFQSDKAVSSPDVTHHLFYENAAYDYSGGFGRLENEKTNIFRAPEFVESPIPNYRPARGSPLRNAGSDTAVEAGDLDCHGQSRILKGKVDIGAVEAPWPTIRRPTQDGGIQREFTTNVSVVYVNAGHRKADDYNTGVSWDRPKATITAGIDAARRNGGEVRVTAGTYSELIFLPPGVRLRGGYEQKKSGEFVQSGYSTIAGAPGDRFGLAMLAADAEIERFAFTNGPAVVCPEGPSTVRNCVMTQSPTVALTSDGGSPTVLNCVFAGNMPAMQLTGGVAQVRGCRFQGNAGAEAAGAMVLADGEAVISDSVFAGNVGGAISMRQTVAFVVNNTFHGNHGYARLVTQQGDVGSTGGAVDSARSALTFVNNIVSRNTGGVQDRAPWAGYPAVRNNCVFENEGFDWRMEHGADPTGRDGNLRVDPRMVAPDHGRFEIMLDSPCRNAGESKVRNRNDSDMKGQPRRQGREVDIGADENETHRYGTRRMVAYVSPTGSDTNTGTSWAGAVRTIGKAIDRLHDAGFQGGEIWVAAGQYRQPVTLPGFCAVYGGFAGREERREQRDPDKNLTELIGNGKGPAVVFTPGAPFNVLDGFTIRGGFGTGYSIQTSGGVVCHPGTTSVIANNILRDNVAEHGHAIGTKHAWVRLTGNTITANGVRGVDDGTGQLQYGTETPRSWSGAAAVFSHSLGVVADNVIEANHATGLCFLDRSGFIARNNLITQNAGDAGGIFSRQCFSEISNNYVMANAAQKNGGGLALEYSMDYIHNNLVSANTSKGIGGGVHSLAGNPLLVNNTVMRNSARDAGAAYLHNAAILYNNIFAFNSSGLAADSILTGRLDPTLVMQFNCVYGNTNYETRGISESVHVARNFMEDPRFMRATDGDYRLDSRSPCIDRGTDYFLAAGDRDIDGQPRRNGAAVDIGAYERPGAPSTVQIPRPSVPSRPPLSASGQRLPGGPKASGSQSRRSR